MVGVDVVLEDLVAGADDAVNVTVLVSVSREGVLEDITWRRWSAARGNMEPGGLRLVIPLAGLPLATAPAHVQFGSSRDVSLGIRAVQSGPLRARSMLHSALAPFKGPGERVRGVWRAGGAFVAHAAGDGAIVVGAASLMDSRRGSMMALRISDLSRCFLLERRP